MKFVNLMEKVKTHDDYKSKYAENKDEHTRRLALEKMVAEIMNRERRKELDLYKLFAGDEPEGEAPRYGLMFEEEDSDDEAVEHGMPPLRHDSDDESVIRRDGESENEPDGLEYGVITFNTSSVFTEEEPTDVQSPARLESSEKGQTDVYSPAMPGR